MRVYTRGWQGRMYIVVKRMKSDLKYLSIAGRDRDSFFSKTAKNLQKTVANLAKIASKNAETTQKSP